MALKDIGPIMFGGTPNIIQYMRTKGFLERFINCGRYYYIIICRYNMKKVIIIFLY